jgi:hypothetical protein
MPAQERCQASASPNLQFSRKDNEMQTTIQRINNFWRRFWLLRWIVANVLAWWLALGIAALFLYLFGIFGALISGAIVGLIIGAAQAHTFPRKTVATRSWILFSALGGFLATLPVYLLGFIALLNLTLGLLLMGAIFGGILAAMQALILRHHDEDRAILWVIACIIGGGLCAPLSLTASNIALPLIFAPGPVVFGLISGWVFVRPSQK